MSPGDALEMAYKIYDVIATYRAKRPTDPESVLAVETMDAEALDYLRELPV